MQQANICISALPPVLATSWENRLNISLNSTESTCLWSNRSPSLKNTCACRLRVRQRSWHNIWYILWWDVSQSVQPETHLVSSLSDSSTPLAWSSCQTNSRPHQVPWSTCDYRIQPGILVGFLYVCLFDSTCCGAQWAPGDLNVLMSLTQTLKCQETWRSRHRRMPQGK